MTIEETFYRSKKFFQKTLRNLKSFLLKCCKSPLANNPIFSDSNKEKTFSKKEGDEQYTKNSITDCSKVKQFEEEKNKSGHSRAKWENPSYLAADHLAQKMKDLDMMDMNDLDHVVDIEEVLHYYSHLKSPVYLEIVDNFFLDMYLEFNLPMPSTRSMNSSMRKLGSTRSINSSMRRLGSTRSINSSMRRLGSTRSINSSMRKVCPASAHGSMRSLGPVKL